MNKAKLFSLSRARIWLFAMGLVLATIFAYRPAWNGSFVWDDDFYVTKNRLLTAPDGLRRIWFSLESPSQYFPLTYTSFRIERSLWGLKPTGYHWVNILLHTANALLLQRLIFETFQKRWSLPKRPLGSRAARARSSCARWPQPMRLTTASTKALETSRRALQTAQEQRNSELAEIIRREMSLYESGLPYRAP